MDKHDAAASLGAAVYSPRRLLAIHGGATVGLSLVLSAISFILNYAISPSGGLGSMDLQAALTTAQVMLRLVQMAVVPIWSAGLCYAAIGIARGQRTMPTDLLEGFRRLKPLLTAGILIALQYAVRVFIGYFISGQLMVFTPFAQQIYDASMENPDLGMLALMDQCSMATKVTYIAVLVLAVVAVSVPVFYRYRLTKYLIVDNQEKGGVRAMLRSRMLMTRRQWELAKLDLSFWWYYLLLVLGMALCYGDLILSALGVALPISEAAAYWIFLSLGLLTQLAVKILAGPKVAVSYAHCYQRFLNQEPPKRRIKRVNPEDLPWTY